MANRGQVQVFDFGTTLRQAREDRGLDLHEIADATRIRVRYLAALEDEQLGQLPEEIYARAFLRTYADYLELDAELFVEELSARLEASRPPPPPLPPEPRFTLPRFDRRVGIALAGSAAILLVGLVAWHDGGSQERMPAALGSGVAGVQKRITNRPAVPKRAVSPPATASLVLVATRGDCWLSVRSGSSEGRVLYEGMLRSGDQVRLPGRRLWVRVGAPWNLEAKRNGRALPGLPPDTGDVVVTPAGLTPA